MLSSRRRPVACAPGSERRPVACAPGSERRRWFWTALGLTLTLCGCRQAGPVRPLDPIPTHEAVGIVNANAAKITATLRASGSVDGYFTTSNGRRRSYHVDGTLFYLAPCYFRFDLKSLGERQILFGSNEEYFWVYSKEDGSYYCGHQGRDEELPTEVPVRPEQLIEALALAPIHVLSHALSFEGLEGADADSATPDPIPARRDFPARKEYRIDRDSPQFIRRVLFRDAEGLVTMQSSLDDYRPLFPGGPVLPGSMIADWPTARAHMRFRVDKWTLVEQVRPGGPQFATPAECFADDRR